MIERGNWGKLKPRPRILKWRHWKMQLKFWLQRRADKQFAALCARKRSMDMARNLSRNRSIR